MNSSRYRDDIVTIFDVFCEIGEASPGEKYAPLLTKYPDDFSDESILKSIQQFAFPCKMKQGDNDAVQLFSFVLTDSMSKYSFGFCRYTPRNDTCICFLTGFFWPNVFYKALNQISVVMNSGSQADLDLILARIYHTDIPNPGDIIRLDMSSTSGKHDVRIPNLNKLPTLREDKFLLEFFNAISPKQMVALYASLLKERRILFTGRRLSQLSSCIHACSTLLYPMNWQYVYIPVLPHSLADMIMAPMPYIIGVPKQITESQNLKEVGDVVIIDVDEKTLESPFDDVGEMPSEVVSFLKSQLKITTDMNDSFARIFLRTNIILFGDYRSGFVLDDNGEYKWNKDRFVQEQKGSYQVYLNSLLGSDGVQYLERFVHERLEMFKKGITMFDEFERELDKIDIKNKVRENASDVIGVLKDKMSGIQIANKLNKLTPKEIRRAASRKRSNGLDFQPMSFDNLQWEAARADNDNFDTSPVEQKTEPSIAVANLIDFDSPVPETNSNGFLDEFMPNQSNNSTARSLNLPTNVFTDPFSLFDSPVNETPASSTANNFQSTSTANSVNQSTTRTGWEKFDD